MTGLSLLPQTARAVDTATAQAQADGQVPSLVTAVVRGGALVHFAGAGELPRPSPDTQYRIGSITKTMTAVLVLSLRDQGRLALDDPLSQYLPGTPIGAVTLRQLLGHVAGLQREPAGSWWERRPGAGVPALLAELRSDQLVHPPYRKHHYSNLAYGLLGALLAGVTGQPFEELLATDILQPLGMARTTYHATEPFARGYVVHPWHGTLREEPRHDAAAMAPAGQLWSTARDLAAWAGFLAEPCGGVLAPAAVDEMCAPVVITDLTTWTAGHGLGLQLWRCGERVYVGHTGSMPGYLAALVVHRPTATGVVCFANAYTLRGAGIGEVARSILTAVLDREPVPVAPWRPGALPPPEAEPLTGRWWWMAQEFQLSWDARRRQLVMIDLADPGDEWRFTAEGPDRWRCRSGANHGEVMQVRRARSGAVTALDIAGCVFTRDPWSTP